MNDRLSRTPLHYAAVDGDAESARDLLAHGADANASDAQGFAPLHFAAQSYSPEIVEMLLAAGADVNAQNHLGNSPLVTAVFHSRGRGETVRRLLAAGADRDLKNNSGISAWDLAQKIANYDETQFFD